MLNNVFKSEKKNNLNTRQQKQEDAPNKKGLTP